VSKTNQKKNVDTKRKSAILYFAKTKRNKKKYPINPKDDHFSTDEFIYIIIFALKFFLSINLAKKNI